jgi:phosphoesterase RecJ-like protein
MKGDFTQDTAMCLFTGIATDCGWFRYSNTTPATMRAAADLLACGVEPNIISEALEQKPYARVKGLADAMQHIEVWHDGRAAGVFLDLSTMEALEHADGLIDMVRIIEGVDIAVVLKEKEPDICRVSMRSKGIDVTKVAVNFGGGGHIRAAGCAIKQPFAEAKAALVAAIDAVLEETP